MKYNQLDLKKNQKRRRLGQGIAAGQGKTAGKGTKGQKARVGRGKRQGFEGGQTPLMMRLPKLRGFKSIRGKAELVFSDELNTLKGVVSNKELFEAGLISSEYARVRIMARGEVTSKVDISLQGASEAAVVMIEKASGSFKKIDIPKRPATRLADEA
jgi:large subunit ribosomal protein L15